MQREILLTFKERISLILENSLKEAIKDGLLPDTEFPPFRVEYPKEQKFGDYASPFALEAAKALRRSPMETAEKLKAYAENHPMVGRVDIASPGYINIFISFNELCSNLKAIISEDTKYGRVTKNKPRKINIEFVSANPTGPMNIVSARAASLGDTIGNLFEAAGDNVEREFYVNDYGNQVNLLGRSVLARIRETQGIETEFPEDGYHGEYVKDIAAHIISNFNDKLSGSEDDLVDFCAKQAVEYNVEAQKNDLAMFNVKFDRWFREKSLHESGAVMNTFELLDANKTVYEQDGKKFFRSTHYGDDKDRVVVRDDGRPTYLLADIAYHKDKIDRKYDTIIDIWGPDHHGYISRLRGAVQALGCPKENFKILIAQQVNLVMDGETVKMSKRLGNFSTMRELIDEIGTDVSRYFFLMRSMESHLDFDLALAKKSSSENPVFYLQYAHARICSLFREASSRGMEYNPGTFDENILDDESCVHLMKLLARYPEEVLDAAASVEPHKIPSFLLKLAQAYHRFYADHRILTDDAAKSNAYLNLSDAARKAIRNGLTILGISAPEKM